MQLFERKIQSVYESLSWDVLREHPVFHGFVFLIVSRADNHN